MSSNSPAPAIADLPYVIVRMHFLVFVKFSVQLKRQLCPWSESLNEITPIRTDFFLERRGIQDKRGKRFSYIFTNQYLMYTVIVAKSRGLAVRLTDF